MKNIKAKPKTKCELFYAYLKKHCPDLESAKKWAKEWAGKGQSCGRYGMFSRRAMAHHISNVLIGKKTEGKSFRTESYMDTKYGIVIYWSM